MENQPWRRRDLPQVGFFSNSIPWNNGHFLVNPEATIICKDLSFKSWISKRVSPWAPFLPKKLQRWKRGRSARGGGGSGVAFTCRLGPPLKRPFDGGDCGSQVGHTPKSPCNPRSTRITR
ncbi:hypothetical protein SAY86_014881 [Trapa natans]|uniref:Uncharacterized protein n=1 Tax=Trapa natans TaxID=22666 RepID=A0AAN7QGC4_TRANT|nr:hypothetical protein SAY86_014881 [Trapa natans]